MNDKYFLKDLFVITDTSKSSQLLSFILSGLALQLSEESLSFF